MTERIDIGDACPQCAGLIGVLNTRVSGDSRLRWLGCRDCGFRPAENKQVVPLRFAPLRVRRLPRRRAA